MNCFEVLNINKYSNLDQIKKAYYKMIKIYPPEDNQEEFIKINKAYKEARAYCSKGINYRYLLEKIKKKNASKEYLEENELMRYIVENINKENFESENEKILELVKELNLKGLKREALFIIVLARIKFEKMDLKGLSGAYKRLEDSIMVRK